MFGINKEKILIVVSAIFVGIVVWQVALQRTEVTEDWVLSQRPRTYYAVPPKEASSDSAALNITGRNPFVSLTQKTEYVIEPPLPDPVRKEVTLAGLTPLPDERFYNKGNLKLPLGKPIPYDNTVKLAQPAQTALPLVESLHQLLDEVAKKLATPEQPLTPTAVAAEEDVLTLKNSIKVTGKYITEDKDTIWFLPSGRSMMSTFTKKEVSDIQRTFTIEELYDVELQKVVTTDAYSWSRLADWCMEKGLDNYAVDALKQAIKINGHEIKFYTKLADCYIKKHQFDSEMSLYQDALKSDLLNKEVIHYRVGRFYERLQLQKEAQDSYEKALSINSTHAQAILRLANIYYQEHNFDLAARMYERLKDSSADDMPFLEGKAEFAYLMGDIDNAKKSLTAYSAKPDTSADAWNTLGMIAALEGDYSNAGNDFLKAIYARPDNTPAWDNLGLLYLAANDTANAEILFNKYAELNPADEMPVVAEGYLKWQTAKPDEAIAQFQSALTMTPDSFMAGYARGQLNFSQQNYADARSDFIRCLNLNPSFNETLYYLAMISFLQSYYKEAIQYYKSYFNQAPAYMVGVSDSANLALCELASGDTAQAKKILESATLKDFVPALCMQAYIKYNEKDVENAIQILKRVHEELDPANSWAQKVLIMIEDASRQIIWKDNFDRKDGKVIGHGWGESEKYGVEINIAGKQCVFAGTQKLSGAGLTYIEKTIGRQSFIKFESTLQSDPNNNAVIGIYIATGSKENALYVARRKLEVVYGFSNRADAPPVEWQSFSRPAIAPDSFKIGIEVVNKGDRPVEFHIYVNDAQCGTIPVGNNAFANTRDATYLLGIFGFAPMNQQWQLAAKTARTFEEKPK